MEKNTIKRNRIKQIKKPEPLTLATIDLGNWLDGKIVLYLGCFGKSKNKA
jgi:hypothetical protein